MMWTEIGIGSSVLIVLMGLVYRIQNGRITQIDKTKVNVESDNIRHKNINKKLERGEKQFDQILDELRKQQEMLGRMDEKIMFLAKMNGMKE